jgi:thiol-disulfide isomerase/thioredoxin
MNFIKKYWGNILFFSLIILMFTPAGMPLRAFVIRSVSYVTSRVQNLEIDKNKREKLDNYHWKMIDSKVRHVSFYEFKDKVVVINNWATWCPPCVAEMPSLQKLYNAYKDKVVFIFLVHDKPGNVYKFIEDNHLDVPVYFLPQNMPKILEATTIPTTFIISKTGEIVVKKTGAFDWNSRQVHRILDELLN